MTQDDRQLKEYFDQANRMLLMFATSDSPQIDEFSDEVRARGMFALTELDRHFREASMARATN